LYEIIISTCNSLNLIIKPIKVKSLIYDLTGGKGRLGKYDAYEIVKNNEKLLTVSIAAHDNHGDDKSKEWGARRLASLYRYDNNCLKKSEYQNALFVLDGEWKQKDIERLHRSGWDHICRLGELEDKLKSIFSI